MNCLKKLVVKWCYKVIENFDDAYNDSENLKSAIQTKEVYWCQMPLSDIELLEVTPGHRIRPYVVEEITEEGIIAFASSSKPFSYVIKEKQLFISKIKYHMSKNSYIDTTKKIHLSWNDIKKYYYTLDDYDFNQINSKRNQKNFSGNQTRELGIGSLIKKDNSLYLIAGIMGNEFLAYKLYNQKERVSNKNYIALSYNSKVYLITYCEQIYLNTQNDYIVIFQYDDSTMKLIRKKMKDIKNKERKK